MAALASVITALDPALPGVQEVAQEETLADLDCPSTGTTPTSCRRWTRIRASGGDARVGPRPGVGARVTPGRAA
ncbi:hypothetical protein ABK046_10125 [Streptomyces caeruleatus]